MKRIYPRRTANTKLIKICLIEQEITQNSIAEKLKKSRTFISKIISGETYSQNAFAAIAQACGKTVDELFPLKEG